MEKHTFVEWLEIVSVKKKKTYKAKKKFIPKKKPISNANIHSNMDFRDMKYC